MQDPVELQESDYTIPAARWDFRLLEKFNFLPRKIPDYYDHTIDDIVYKREKRSLCAHWWLVLACLVSVLFFAYVAMAMIFLPYEMLIEGVPFADISITGSAGVGGWTLAASCMLVFLLVRLPDVIKRYNWPTPPRIKPTWLERGTGLMGQRYRAWKAGVCPYVAYEEPDTNRNH